MDAETRSHIFDPAPAGDDARKRARIGLAPVYGVVKQNGGYIWVESESGSGTCVSVYMPQARHEAAPQAAPAAAATAAAGRCHTIMVVESFESLRSFVCEFLRHSHYNVIEATTGEQAVEIAQQGAAIDLIVCDVILPGMSGLEVADCVARVQPQAEMLYLAGYAEDTLFLEDGMPDSSRLLTAPFHPQELSKKIAALLKAKRAAAGAGK